MNKYRLVIITEPGCQPCKSAKTDIFVNDTIPAIDRLIAVHVFTQNSINQDYIKNLQVTGFPTFVIIQSQKGVGIIEIARITGYPGPQGLNKFIIDNTK